MRIIKNTALGEPGEQETGLDKTPFEVIAGGDVNISRAQISWKHRPETITTPH